MKLGDRVAIVCDHTMAEEAGAIRAVLEANRLRADLYRLVQRWQAEEFFARRAKEYEYVVICCHGSLKPVARIKFEVIVPKKENPELGDMVEFDLTAENIPDRLTGFTGVVVSTACESGAEELGGGVPEGRLPGLPRAGGLLRRQQRVDVRDGVLLLPPVRVASAGTGEVDRR